MAKDISKVEAVNARKEECAPDRVTLPNVEDTTDELQRVLLCGHVAWPRYSVGSMAATVANPARPPQRVALRMVCCRRFSSAKDDQGP